MSQIRNILIIQTAFIGDVILATPVIEALKEALPDTHIDFLLRKGNESLMEGHPKINQVLIWDKKGGKYKNLFNILKSIRKQRYTAVINLQRFGATGFITAFSGAPVKIGFSKNPFSVFFTHRIKHRWGNFVHETERNLDLLQPIAGKVKAPMKLYPSLKIAEQVLPLQQKPYLCLAPTSVWFTKQMPEEKWIEFINRVPEQYTLYLLGAKSDAEACTRIANLSGNKNVINLCGKLNLLQSAVLMQGAKMNYVNDSAPLHLASAMNAPVTAIFCSTVPAFGFGPQSEKSIIVESNHELDCRPCGMHGFKKCPKGHFKCGFTIDINLLLSDV